MTETTHIEQHLLIDYLYGEADESARARVEAHLRSCARCAAEVSELRDVRATLGEWAPPEAELGFRLVSERDTAPVAVTPSSSWMARPRTWGLAAAAVLMLAAAASLANLQFEMGEQGVVVRVGWGDPSAVEQVSPTDLANLRDELRREMQTLQPAQSAGDAPLQRVSTPGADAPWIGSVRDLIRESEERQQLVFDNRVREAEQRIASQRRSDLSEMERTFREVDAEDAELARQQLMEYLRRVSR